MSDGDGYAYSGEKVPPNIPTCVYEGWLDATKNFIVYPGILYRRPIWKRAGWIFGYLLGKLISNL